MINQWKVWLARLGMMGCFIATYHTVFATHNRAGEITYKQVGPLTIEVKVTTYTKTSSSAADRDSLEVFWGDGTSEFVQRVNGSGTPLPNDIKINEYIKMHTYPGRSTYTIYFQDPNRVGSILNVNFPNSIDVPFFLSTTFTLLNSQFQGQNNSAILLQPPIDIACIGQTFIHNPNAYDPDGDSLAYELVAPMEGPNIPVNNYKFPNEILAGPNNIISLDRVTGDFVWKSPPQEGEYNIAIKIKEYRRGILITSIIRDMQIKIVKCNNEPPVIEAPSELCVIAGEKIKIDLKIDDPNDNQKVLLTATGGPFILPRDSAFTVGPTGFSDIPYQTTFEWQTTCNHASQQPYQLVFRAMDNFIGDTLGLATFHTIRIKVVAPPPVINNAEVIGNDISLTWDMPYDCEDTDDNYFQGFSVWRKAATNPLDLDSCQTGLDGQGYEEIVFITKLNDGDDYFYIDQGLENGKIYCYRVQAEFALLTNSGNLYNRVESLPSNEVCLQLNNDLPLITKVSVSNTEVTTGTMEITWNKPDQEQLTQKQITPPYIVEIWQKSQDSGPWSVIPDSRVSITDFTTFIDTNYIHQGINTFENAYQYYPALYGSNNTIPYGTTDSASSVYLSIVPSDKQNRLNWQSRTPWTNTLYKVYRKEQSSQWQLLVETKLTTFNDIGLENGSEYCYYIEAEGTYSLRAVASPLINLSQEACAVPADNLSPCPPKIEVTNICEDIEEIVSLEDVFNTVSWQDPNIYCELREPIGSYQLYFAKTINDTFQLISTFAGNTPKNFQHSQASRKFEGCYYMTASDMLGNESIPSDTICMINCPLYELPNTFTPNGDGFNDIFKPTRNVFIERIDLKIYNEWGNLVFQTNDPAIEWNGRKDNTGSALSEATYYYVCKVYEATNAGNLLRDRPLKGYINLVR